MTDIINMRVTFPTLRQGPGSFFSRSLPTPFGLFPWFRFVLLLVSPSCSPGCSWGVLAQDPHCSAESPPRFPCTVSFRAGSPFRDDSDTLEPGVPVSSSALLSLMQGGVASSFTAAALMHFNPPGGVNWTSNLDCGLSAILTLLVVTSRVPVIPTVR